MLERVSREVLGDRKRTYFDMLSILSIFVIPSQWRTCSISIEAVLGKGQSTSGINAWNLMSWAYQQRSPKGLGEADLDSRNILRAFEVLACT